MVRSRQSGLALPEDPTEEELARDSALLEADRVQVLRCRGEDNRRRFATGYIHNDADELRCFVWIRHLTRSWNRPAP